MALRQHFDFPLAFQGHLKIVEQDSDDDIINCVRVALLTPRGSRFYVPNFGVDDPTFDIPSLKSKLLVQAQASEPRASLSAAETIMDDLTDEITIGVGNVG